MTQEQTPKYQWMDYGNGLTLVDVNLDNRIALMAFPTGQIATYGADVGKNRPMNINDVLAKEIPLALNCHASLVKALKAIDAEFVRLHDAAETVRDKIYLDAVIAVVRTISEPALALALAEKK